MTTKKLNTRGMVTAEAIGNREEFDTHGALSTERDVSFTTMGRLNEFERACLRHELECGAVEYVVFSYGTPIAWTNHDGSIHKVTQKFSVTTSKHQGMLYMLNERD